MERLCLSIGIFIVIRVCFSLRFFTSTRWDEAFPLARKGITVTNTTQLRFKLKACSAGHLILQKDEVVDLETYGSWAFVIDTTGNRRSEIRPAVLAGALYGVHYEALLDCNEFRQFWTRWKGRLLELGKGSEFGTDRISFHTITPVEFKYAFLLTGWGSSGCWDIDTSSSILASSWTKLSGNKKLEGSNVTSHHARSQLECGVKCMTPTEDLPCGCVVYSYNKLTKQCLVVDESETSTIVTSTGWRTWQLM